MRILVTGGAGYIGSVTAALLLRRGHEVVILDDLSTGHGEAVPRGAELVEGRVQDAPALDRALDRCEAVVHFASLSLVGESVQRPLHYFRENLGSALALIEGMGRAGVDRMVFSSSAAVYGQPSVEVIQEDQPRRPVNPYGRTKAMIEEILAEQGRAAGLAATALRYFNACGADGPRGEDHHPETHLIPRLCLHLLGRLPDFAIHGGDYPTPDGTAVRDYVHVLDLAEAHALALEAETSPGLSVYNLGSGVGASVREVLAAAAAVTGRRLEAPVGPRRPGDPPRLVASFERARRGLGWRPRRDLETILADAWAWHREHPGGYAADPG